ncbi:hypothetical protein EDD29_3042 [Actinocorallia herbida]|uniref:Uncharacterized protein n=1 Tax=Actinocorallia herbida TaxID=58109 RepID=A0A3N1CW42_9ACTN|nr:hypothetical protein [Actinocorallia herbida]ROO85497.1 hypothetical protein EDD29_3042 [Actinocorallia herbida]
MSGRGEALSARRRTAIGLLGVAAAAATLVAYRNDGGTGRVDAAEPSRHPRVEIPAAEPGMRTLLVTPVRRGDLILDPIDLREGREISIMVICGGDGSIRVELGLPEPDRTNFVNDFECEGADAGATAFQGPVHFTATVAPKVVATGDVNWAVRIQEAPASR